MGRVLIVDDNARNIQLLGNILTENSYEVEYVLSGEDALDMLESENFDLILMDVMMPGMDGFETCKRIKQTNRADIPLIFLTAINEKESITKGFEVGGVDYLSKPFNTAELLARISTHIALKKSNDELNDINRSLEQKVIERTEELLIANDKLRQANDELAVLDQSKNEFLSIINHEIRTPLNGIIGFVNVIKASVKDEILLNMITQLDESCNRLEEFSFQALDISNLTTRRSNTLNLVSTGVDLLINLAIDKLDTKLLKKEIHISSKIESCNLNLDVKYFSKCIYLLISNSIKHSAHRSNISIVGRKSDQSYHINIKDEGVGFPEKLLKNGIKAFVSTHIDNNPGLELYLCKLIIESHKGSLSIQNDKGALVQIQLSL
nr:hybrid sensor histidine kinase/response regulator [uncultured Carboxylicivirga sp.]